MRDPYELGHVEISKRKRTYFVCTQMVLSEKPIKHIELTKEEWLHLRDCLIKDYGSKILISWVMRRECGFTIREHTQWTETKKGGLYPETIYCLDFYDEQMKVWYLLKYS